MPRFRQNLAQQKLSSWRIYLLLLVILGMGGFFYLFTQALLQSYKTTILRVECLPQGRYWVQGDTVDFEGFAPKLRQKVERYQDLNPNMQIHFYLPPKATAQEIAPLIQVANAFEQADLQLYTLPRN
ncbi:hypothetical protein SapgrDRAFT_2964 [Saprospira grandis DSM 2844]|uniref:Biopolymer transport protein n=1 Tax=Saprospira grandis DSM 2844 TaxID=694433 RepID=J1I866_9BACT|nr:hypothetical protein [Saprospira grandis]EJF54613.1 hypothetical protein SapgrDRAFT_2964 [Saprospira grandis DSM 2844]